MPGQINKKPAIDWQSRVSLKSFVNCLNVRIRDAKNQGTALPCGDVATIARRLVHFDERGVHFLSRIRNTIGLLVSTFRL